MDRKGLLADLQGRVFDSLDVLWNATKLAALSKHAKPCNTCIHRLSNVASNVVGARQRFEMLTRHLTSWLDMANIECLDIYVCVAVYV